MRVQSFKQQLQNGKRLTNMQEKQLAHIFVEKKRRNDFLKWC